MLKNKKFRAGIFTLILIFVIIPSVFLKQYLIKLKINEIINSSKNLIESGNTEKILDCFSQKYFDAQKISKTDFKKILSSNKRFFEKSKITILKKDFDKIESDTVELKLKALIKFNSEIYDNIDGLESIRIIFTKQHDSLSDNNKKWLVSKILRLEKY
ncbi:MAG TPA: hypothetical protein PKY81_14790 [bacterium]|nr:hypothetical protein [bacterium]HPN32215.1 hypothetical protein [bacterium]